MCFLCVFAYVVPYAFFSKLWSFGLRLFLLSVQVVLPAPTSPMDGSHSNNQEGPTSISVFCNAMDGDDSGKMQSPGVEAMRRLLNGANLKVSLDAIRNIYNQNEWAEDTSIDQEKFTTLWTAVIAIAKTTPSKNQGVKTIPAANAAKPSEKLNSRFNENEEEKKIEAQVQALLHQMWEKHLDQIPDSVRDGLVSTAFEVFAK